MPKKKAPHPFQNQKKKQAKLKPNDLIYISHKFMVVYGYTLEDFRKLTLPQMFTLLPFVEKEYARRMQQYQAIMMGNVKDAKRYIINDD